MFSVSMSSKYHHTHPIQEKEYIEKLKIELGNSLPVKKNFSLSSFFPSGFQCPTVLLRSVIWQRKVQTSQGSNLWESYSDRFCGIFGLCFIVVLIKRILSLSIFFHYFYCLAGISNMRQARVS